MQQPGDLFQFGWFNAHSGMQLPWKLDADALSDGSIEALAKIIAGKFSFGKVYGVPRGGVRLARALEAYCETEAFRQYPVLVVDDVLTTGRSMEEAKKIVQDGFGRPAIGVVIFARCQKDDANVAVPNWVFPICTVSDWAQARGTGLG
jgi:hypoxanthine phosphoribosyltransferase